MFKSIARLGAAFIAAITLSLPAAASTYSIDYTDLWGGGQPAPTENGWGLNLVQQGDAMFGTMFVYGSDSTARWFSVTLVPSNGGATWSGTLDQTTGSFYGGAWNNGSVTHLAVGTMTINFSSANAGSLSYTANGATVNKQISRFTFRAPNLAGHYIGGATALCNNSTANAILIFDNLTVSQSGTTVSMAVDFFNAQGTRSLCTFNGNINTTGRTGSISGTYSCSGGANNVGSFTITNLESTINGFNGNFQGADQFCSNIGGRFGGVKDVL